MWVARQQLLEQAKDQINVQATLMCLVNHDSAQIGNLPVDNPVDQCTICDVDQPVPPV